MSKEYAIAYEMTSLYRKREFPFEQVEVAELPLEQ